MSASTISLLPEQNHENSDTEHAAVLTRVSSRAGSTSDTLGLDTAEDVSPRATSPQRFRWSDIPLLLGIVVMLCWPWVFIGVLLHRGVISLSGHFAEVVKNNPRTTNFFLTNIGTIIHLIVGFLFSTAILRYSQGWIARKEHISLFHLSLISAFMAHNFPWGPKDHKYLLARKRWVRVALVAACIFAFTFVTPGVTTTLTPLPVHHRVPLTGTELNFSSTAPDCLEWLETKSNLILPNTCQWKKYNDLNYNTCRDGEMTDILDSGRINVLSLNEKNFEVVSFSGLGAQDGLQFIGPLLGVIPIGPDGVDAFDTLESSPLNNAKKDLRGDINSFLRFSYSYTLHQQGIASDISCSYDSQSPVRVYPSDRDTVGIVQFNGTCDGQADVLDGKTFTSLNSDNSLTFWACKSLSDPAHGSSYILYLRGLQSYAKAIGNITCTATLQPAIFPVTFISELGVFSSSRVRGISSTTNFTGFIDQAVVALGSLIADAQTQQTNLVAESVTALGVKYFNITTDEQQAEHLPLYEAMIQGILEYEVAYTRLLYSTFTDQPPSCNGTVKGKGTYNVLGWSFDNANIGYLMPMTVINLTSFILLLMAIIRTRGSVEYDPTDPEVLALVKHERYVAGKHGDIEHRLVFPEKIDSPPHK